MWQRGIATAAILITKIQPAVEEWMHWGLTCYSRQSAVAQLYSLNLFASIWAVGTVKNSLTTHFLIFAYLDGVYSGQLPVCLVVWTGSP